MSELVRRLEDEYGVQLFLRGRRLVLTGAGEELSAYAENAVAAAEHAAQALRSVRTLTGGSATLGLLRNAEFYLLPELVRRFHELHPDVRVRLTGLNSVDVASAVRAGTLEGGVVVLPVDGEGLRVDPWARDEVVLISADPSHVAAPAAIDQIAQARLVLYDAHVGWADPTRRQLAERAESAGLHIDAHIEVEHVQAALGLVALGLGDTIASRAVFTSRDIPDGLRATSLDPPMFDTLAFVRRAEAPLSSATREFAALAKRMVRANHALLQL